MTNALLEPEIVRARGLGKSYGALAAVKGIDFEIRQGEIFGLIGPDGAGKTTTFHIMGGVLEKNSGEIAVLGGSPRNMRLSIGYLTQQFSLYLDLSLIENLRYVAGLRDVTGRLFEERAARYLKLMDLDRFPNRLAGQLSGGMKQKLALCCALVGDPKLLLLDEPTTGVDPVSRREFWDLLSRVCSEGVTVAVATPYLDEAERCGRLILMHEGRILEEGSPAGLKERLGMHRLEVRSGKLHEMEKVLSEAQSLQAKSNRAERVLFDVQTFGDRLDVLVPDLEQGRALVRQLSQKAGLSEPLLSEQEPTLENVFVARLKHDLPEEEQKPFPFVAVNRGSRETSSPALVNSAKYGAIEASAVSKRFGNFQAVRSVSLRVEYGEIYGLLGANGAGKTTTIKILCGLIKPSGGSMALCGQVSDLRQESLRQKLGYMSQKFTLYDDLTIRENLEFYCGVYCVPEALRKERIAWVLRSSELTGQEGLLAGKLPGGWKQRLSFGAAVLHQPQVLFLDEPTSGVDPLARREMWKLIRDFSRQGTAILVTTHFLEEAENCNNLGFMVAGELVAEGSPSRIKEEQPGTLYELVCDDLQGAYARLKGQLEDWRTSMFADCLHVVLDDGASELPAVLSALSAEGVKIRSHRQVPFSLEDCFISIVQRAQRAHFDIAAKPQPPQSGGQK